MFPLTKIKDDFAFGILHCPKGSGSGDPSTESIVVTDPQLGQSIMHEAQSPQLGRRITAM